jgi:hypothetical protein
LTRSQLRAYVPELLSQVTTAECGIKAKAEMVHLIAVFINRLSNKIYSIHIVVISRGRKCLRRVAKNITVSDPLTNKTLESRRYPLELLCRRCFISREQIFEPLRLGNV